MPRADPPHRAPVWLTRIQRLGRRFPKRKGGGEAGAPQPTSPAPQPTLTGGAAVRPDED